MENNYSLKEKLQLLIGYYDELKEYTDISLEEYLNNRKDRRAIERTLQLIVETATDINNMILKLIGQPAATDYFNSFIELAENNIISMDFALKIAPSTGLRNILVHEYQKVDDEIVYNSITDVLHCYKNYIRLISEYLNL